MDPTWNGELLGHVWLERMPSWVRILDHAPKLLEAALRISGIVCACEQLEEDRLEVHVQVREPFMRQEEGLDPAHQA